VSDGSCPVGVVARAVRPSDGAALVALFQREGSPCFCRYWHFSGTNKEWEARCAFGHETSAAELVDRVSSGHEEGRGVVAFDGDLLVGWMKLVPRTAMTKLLVKSPYKGLDAPPDTLGIGCFLVDPTHRRRGVAGVLLDAAIDHARAIGAGAIEAWPRTAHEGGAAMHDGELFMGPTQLFEARGFEVVRSEAPYPTLRLALR
jgi:GNAT superfamily N-acetyltransferase